MMRMIGLLDLFLYFTRCLGVFHRDIHQDFGWPYRDAERIVCLRCGRLRDPRDDE